MTKKIKLASVAPSQLPAHIRQDYPTFEAFMKAYYEYLDQQQLTRNLEFVRDVDKTLDRFIENIKDEIAALAPRLAKDRFFLKHAKEVYVSRGSEESYKFLFRLLYNKNVETVQLGDKMLKVSGGNWQQDVSFFIKVESGNVVNLENKFIYIQGTNNRERVYVLKTQRVEFVAEQNVYEVFINRQFFGKLEPGYTINAEGVKAKLVPTTTSITVTNGGSGFKIGQVLNISTSLGTGLSAKVVSVDKQTGAIKGLQIISFGVGFEQPFDYNITRLQIATASQSVNLNVKEIQSLVGDPPVLIDGWEHRANQTDIISDSTDFGKITRQNFHEDYVAGDYVGEVLADFYAKSYPDEVEVTIATLRINLGALATYPGSYRDSTSLISDDSYIQDGYFYQDFSYLLRIDEQISTYRDIISSTLHPIGRKMFGDYLIETDYDFTYEVFNPVIRLFFPFTPESDEDVDARDKVISFVSTSEFIGDGETTEFTYIGDPNLNHVVLMVRRGARFGVDFEALPIESPSNYSIANGKVTFLVAPTANQRISVLYATINYNANPAWADHTVALSKAPIFDGTDGVFDPTPAKASTKILTPATGYNSEALPNTTLRTNFNSKTLPSQETLLDPASTENQKDRVVLGDTGTAAGADPETSLVLRAVNKVIPSTVSTVAPTISVPLLSLSKTVDPDQVLAQIILPTYTFGKALDDEALAVISVPTYSFSKTVDPDQITLEEAPAIAIAKSGGSFLSSAIPADSLDPFLIEKGLTEELLTDDNTKFFSINKYFEEEVLLVDQALVSWTKQFSDEVVLIDEFKVTNEDGAYLSQVTLAETQLTSSLSKTIDNIDDQITQTTNAWLQLNPYSSEAYFPNGYQSGGTTNL